jgi:hypothetical protein
MMAAVFRVVLFVLIVAVLLLACSVTGNVLVDDHVGVFFWGGVQ